MHVSYWTQVMVFILEICNNILKKYHITSLVLVLSSTWCSEFSLSQVLTIYLHFSTSRLRDMQMLTVILLQTSWLSFQPGTRMLCSTIPVASSLECPCSQVCFCSAWFKVFWWQKRRAVTHVRMYSWEKSIAGNRTTRTWIVLALFPSNHHKRLAGVSLQGDFVCF